MMYKATADETEILLAREALYRLLAAVMRHPGERLKELRVPYTQALVRTAVELLQRESAGDDIPLGFGELHAADLDPDTLFTWWNGPPDDLFGEYDRVFGIGPTPDVPPYETEFCTNQEPFYRAQQMADVAGFYRAFGLRANRDRPDHIGLELEFMAHVAMKERRAAEEGGSCATEWVEVCRTAQRSFLRDHLIWWLPSLATGLRRKAASGPYVAVANMLAAFVPLERARFGLKTPWIPVRPRSEAGAEGEDSCAGCTPTT